MKKDKKEYAKPRVYKKDFIEFRDVAKAMDIPQTKLFTRVWKHFKEVNK